MKNTSCSIKDNSKESNQVKKLTSIVTVGLCLASVTLPLAVKAQGLPGNFVPSPCNWFTGVYAGNVKAVIVHIGADQLAVYEGDLTPLSGQCTANDEIEVTFANGDTLQGWKSGNNVKWSNDTVWRRQARTVSYPLRVF
jgi:hypothetical protein